jgi:tetratricopeptide (TPR) repeat protein
MRAIELNQDGVQAYSTLAKTLLRLERLDEAEKYLRLALKKYPNSIVNYFSLSQVLRKKGEAAKVEGILNELLIMRPNLAEGHYNLGVILHDLEEYDGAAESYKRAIAFNDLLSLSFLAKPSQNC